MKTDNPKIYVRTVAYNAENTIIRTIESVLNQTYGNIIYILRDNGSEDNTYDLCSEYAKKDSRIILLRNRKNYVFETKEEKDVYNFEAGIVYGTSLENEDFLFFVDADDECKPDFLKKMITFMEENHLDIAACGNDFINTQTNQIQRIRNLNSNLILDNRAGFNRYFPYYHQFMRTIWGKLYRASSLKNYDLQNYSKNFIDISYGRDTIYCLKTFALAKRVGILAESLYKYYVFPKSTSYKLDNMRIRSDQILHDETTKFLLDKVGFVSAKNKDFLFTVYLDAVRDTLNVLLNAQISAAEKFKSLHDIFASSQTRELVDLTFKEYPKYNENKNILFKSLTDWIFMQKDYLKSGGAERASEILLAIYTDLEQILNKDDVLWFFSRQPEVIEYWLKNDYSSVIERLKNYGADKSAAAKLKIAAYRVTEKPDDELFAFLTDVKIKQPQLDVDTQIIKIAGKYSLLSGVTPTAAVFLRDSVIAVLRSDLQTALDVIFKLAENEIPDEYAENYLKLAQNLCAAAEYTEGWVIFKKSWVDFLIKQIRFDEARTELNDLIEILPDDEELKILQEKYSDAYIVISSHFPKQDKEYKINTD